MLINIDPEPASATHLDWGEAPEHGGDTGSVTQLITTVDPDVEIIREGSAYALTDSLFALGENVFEIDLVAGTARISQPIPTLESSSLTFHFLDEATNELYFTKNIFGDEPAVWKVPVDGSGDPVKVNVNIELGFSRLRAFAIEDF